MEKILHDHFDTHIEAQNGRLELAADENARGALLIEIPETVGNLDISFRAGAYSHTRILMLRKSRAHLSLTVSGEVLRDAEVRIGLLDLQDQDLDFSADIHLLQEGAGTDLYTGELIHPGSFKKNSMNVVSETRHTYGTMHNFAVLQDRAGYEMVAAGKIVNGASGSESHQETRVLTLGSDHRTKVLPILYIDENDVKASHAMTVGQPDSDQLYYLESRGLSRMQSMSLLSIGYFMPVIDLAGSEKLRQDLREELERKAGLYGHQE